MQQLNNLFIIREFVFLPTRNVLFKKHNNAKLKVHFKAHNLIFLLHFDFVHNSTLWNCLSMIINSTHALFGPEPNIYDHDYWWWTHLVIKMFILNLHLQLDNVVQEGKLIFTLFPYCMSWIIADVYNGVVRNQLAMLLILNA